MGEHTKEYMSKIHHRLDANSTRRKTAEVIFLSVFLVIMAFTAGYVIGSLYPMKPDNMPWAENLQKAKKRH